MLSLIVAFDNKFGIGKNNALPWNIREDMLFFSDITKNNLNNSQNKNAIIIGKNTYQSIGKALPDRINIVVSSTLKDDKMEDNIIIALTIEDAIKKANDFKCPNIFICGGSKIYEYALNNLYFDNIYLTHISKDYECDTFIKFSGIAKYPLISSKSFKINNIEVGFRHYSTRISPCYDLASQEYQYINLIEDIIHTNQLRMTRNGNTLCTFGKTLVFDISESIPILTTKKIVIGNVIEELLFFLSGETDTKKLASKNVVIWNANTNRQFLDSVGLKHYEEGDMGPMYGFQLMHYGEDYKGCNKNYEGYNQFEYCLNLLKTDPYSRRILMTTYNPKQADEGCLYPCHGISIIFNVDNDHKLSCMMTQRSVDVMCGLPWNILSYSILVYIMCELVNNDSNYNGKKMTPGSITMCLGDTHIYEVHREQAIRQVLRLPLKFPKLEITNKPKALNEITFNNFILHEYNHHPYLPVKMVA